MKNILSPQLKLLYHGDRVKEWLEGRDVSPVLVEISPTGYCNAKCDWCFFKDKRGGENIDKDVMLRTLKEMSEMGVKAINWTGGGEPNLHPQFTKFVKYADELGLEQGIFTNGYLPLKNEKIFKWIRISMTPRGFEAISVPKVRFGINVNLYEDIPLNKWCKEAKLAGASYFQVRPALLGDYRDQPKLSVPHYLKKHETSDFSIYLTPYKFEEATKPRTYTKCYGHYFCPSIDWRGKLSVCMYRTLEDDYNLGDLNVKSFKEIWKDKLPSPDLVNEKCQNCCKNHEINKVLFGARNLKDVNFL